MDKSESSGDLLGDCGLVASRRGIWRVMGVSWGGWRIWTAVEGLRVMIWVL